jgi:RNA polymerase sigma-70 factor (ECF subfamily)
MMEQYSDHEWIRRLKENDPEAVEALWAELFKTAVSYARFRGIDEDLARDATVEAYLRIKNKGIYKFTFKGSLRGYCYRILAREIIRLVNKASRELLTEEFGSKPSTDPGTEDAPSRSSLDLVRQRIRECLDELPSREREIIELLYFAGLSPEQVAEQLGITRNYVNVLAHRARKKLKDCLESAGFYTPGDVLGL